MGRIVEFATKHRLPAMDGRGLFPERGGLMSYGIDFAEHVRASIRYVDKILKGAKPADLPVEQPTKFELVINMRTAKALRLTIPQSILVRADEIINERRVMDRRAFITGIGSALAAPLAHAQQANRPARIAFLPDFSPSREQRLKLCREIARVGEDRGRDYVFYRSGVFYEGDTKLALDRVMTAKPDLILTFNLGYAIAAHRRPRRSRS